MAKIAVTDAELRHPLNIVRQMKGDEVHAISRIPLATSFYSRFTNKKIRINNYDEVQWEEYDTVFFVTDEANEFGIQQNLENTLLPSKGAFEKLRDKYATLKLCRRLKVPYPKTKLLKKYADDFEYPVIVKPTKGSGSRGRQILQSSADAEKYLPGLLKEFGQLLVQELIDKRNTFGTEVMYVKGDEKAVFQHKRLREYPVDGGPSTLRESIVDEETRELTTRIMEKLKWNGVAMAEFGITKDGPVLFEINPRWWGSLALAIHSGVNFPQLYRDFIVKGDCDTVTTYRVGVKCKYLLFGDVLHFVSRKKPFGLIASLFERTRHDILSWTDPLPGLMRVPMAIYYLTKPDLRRFALR
ncbi:MAG: ATP-grasp domain-containing protein [Candidatus Altiarchaeota archaeon]|nr:ATP-grasp domain-containing protein [Candidatus Altiarchaeota archaeon]